MIQQIFILHHTHVDLGYTATREKVCGDLVEMVGDATRLVESHRGNSESQQFRWVHEVSWPVLEYIRTGGGYSQLMFDQIRRGDAELTAFYVNPTELFDRYEFESTIDLACELARGQQLPLTTAMFSDCPSLPWGVVDMLASRGVRYLSAGPDFIMAHMLEFERPFYWEGPRGGRVLVWCADWRINWYAEGCNVLKLHDDPAGATERLMSYIHRLEGEGYRWEGLAIHFANDNAPPEPRLLDFVRYFNESQSGRQACMATNTMFFEFMERRHGGEFAVRRGAWPDWWANGHGSAAFETACSRRAKHVLQQCRAMASAGEFDVRDPLFAKVADDILMYDEHTFGHNTATLEPWHTIARSEWAIKRNYALRAVNNAELLKRKITAASAKPGQVTIINPSDTEWRGVITLTNRPQPAKPVSLSDVSDGEVIVGQRDVLSPFAFAPQDHYAISVPAGGSRTFERVSRAVKKTDVPDGLENDYYRIMYDTGTGAIREIYDKGAMRPLCQAEPPCWSFAELIHERIVGGSREKLYDIRLGMLSEKSKPPRPDFIQTPGHRLKRKPKQVRGGVYNALITRGSLPGVRFTREVRLYHAFPRIDVVLHLDKQIDITYESLYLAFPFEAENPEIRIELAGDVYRAGVDQFYGSAADWHSLGDYLAVSDATRTVLLAPRDCPLVQIGEINTGKWAKKLEITNGHVYSWVMNNMWPTNFPIYQEGQMTFSWSITSRVGKFDPAAAQAFVRNCRDAVIVDPDAPPITWSETTG